MVLIIGAGLSGLTTGFRLKEAGIPFKIIEARGRIGGRIHTTHDPLGTAVEMGATWFQHQHRHLISLLEALRIGHFQQVTDSTVYYQKSVDLPTQRVQIPAQSPSYRIYGGTSNLINELAERLDTGTIFLNQPVTKIDIQENTVNVCAKDTFEGSTVVLALPPKLWANKITFSPALPSELLQLAERTHTWMEDSIKIGLTYESPFWQQDSMPSTLFSNSGPITELYDHGNAEKSKYALCGFMNPALKTLTLSHRQELVKTQLRTVFGEKALGFTDYKECVWSSEDYTAISSTDFLFPHQNNGNPIFRLPYFKNKLLISSSESAETFPGYMDGALQAGISTAEKLIKMHQNQT